ncbi:MAG TPA: hypothetical protein VNA24_36055 [Hyalangium sp.]|nr:hypothetical protein [Hyalangium sp.]
MRGPWRRIAVLWAVGLLGACGAEPELPPTEPAPAAVEQAAFSYFPMGFARVSASGGVVTQFNSTGGAVTVSRSTGSYTVTFAGLGAPVSGASSGGHVQISAEGTGNVRCRSMGWSGSPNLSASVQCNAPDGSLADSAFAILFFRYTLPAPSTLPATSAYTWVTASGGVSAAYDYNSSGTHNTVTKTATGRYTVRISNATAVNASMMVTSYSGAAGTVCSVGSWGASLATIECRDRLGNLADSAFNFSYSVTGPTRDQQGAHAWFNGSSAHSTYSSALGKVSWCSPASVTGSRSGSLATIVVSGELGSWDASPFLRASFVNSYGTAGYCKVESLTSVEGSPSASTTTVRCYSATGATLATPVFTFTQVTSDATGPC